MDTVRNRILQAAACAAACLAFAPLSSLAFDARAVTLVDQSGANVRIAQLRGHPVVITFVATRCSDACPIANAEFSRLRAILDRRRVAATLLTITLDPAFDSPFVMGREAQRYGANGRTWKFVSGRVSDVRAMMSAFGVVATPDRHGVPDVHSSFVYVLDGSGRLARTLLLSSNLPDDVATLFRGKHAIR